MQKKEKNIMSIVGFVLAFLFPIAGIVVSAIALKKAKSGEYETDYAGLAKAGLIISIIAVVLEVLTMIFAMTIIAGAAATANEMINTLPSGMLIG